MQYVFLPIFLLIVCAIGLAIGLLIVGQILNPIRHGSVKLMPYESGMDPIHDARRRFDVRFCLLAIAFLVFDVELLFLYPWAVVSRSNDECRVMNDELTVESKSNLAADIHHSSFNNHHSSLAPVASRHVVFAGAMTFLALLTLGFVYDWRKGVFQWR
ncbi:MAG: NADH-quinone oxidoreductase subunit A [Planctomycetes bacterium]|nr:NADH-quinone oxidoreductase subunit A [Planctomycetota bacterium]MCG2684317.1 NADH-quinone oxidoreductase subunit A [Planctomycetales bacterium]